MAMKPAYEEGNEYSIKAMFIYNFTKHIEWPAAADDGVFRIGVIGKSSIVEALQAIAAEKKVNKKTIEIRKISGEENVSCQMVFIAKSQQSRLEEFTRRFAAQGVLIISEECKHCGTGVAINLITTDSKVRFELNQAATHHAGLHVSNALTSLAIVVNP